jgi:hypothetical protein
VVGEGARDAGDIDLLRHLYDRFNARDMEQKSSAPDAADYTRGAVLNGAGGR